MKTTKLPSLAGYVSDAGCATPVVPTGAARYLDCDGLAVANDEGFPGEGSPEYPSETVTADGAGRALVRMLDAAPVALGVLVRL